MNLKNQLIGRALQPALSAVLIITSLGVINSPASHADGGEKNYNVKETAKAAPAGTFAAGAGGDGWGISVYNGKVYNIYHNSSGVLTLDCHNRDDGRPCFNTGSPTAAAGWTASSYVIQHQSNTAANTPNTLLPAYGPGQWIDNTTGMMYAYTVNKNGTTYTPGIVKVDLSKVDTRNLLNHAATFTATAAATVACSNSVGNNCLTPTIGLNRKVFSVNFVNATYTAGTSADANKLMCFDVDTGTECGGARFDLGTVVGTKYNVSQVGVFGDYLLIPVSVAGTTSAVLKCIDTAPATIRACVGWTAPTDSSFSGYGGAFPILDSTGSTVGVCIPDASIKCYNMSGTLLTSTTFTTLTGATTTNLTTVMPNKSGSRNGHAIVVGTRVFVPTTNDNSIHCIDWSVSNLVCSASAAGKSFPFNAATAGASSVYTVGADSNDPTCIWLNSDRGTATYTVPGTAITISGVGQIQSFDAYGGGACGSNGIRVVLSQLINPSTACTPTSYISMQLSTPNDPTFTSGFSGTVSFLNAAGTQLKDAANANILPATPNISDTGLISLTMITGLSVGVIPTIQVLLKHGGTDYSGDIEVNFSYTAPAVGCAPVGYSELPYQISFDPNGPTGTDGEVLTAEVTQGAALNSATLVTNATWNTSGTITTGTPTTSPSWTGHNPFIGWFTSPTGGAAFSGSTIPTGNRTYFAHWTQPQWVITYNTQGGDQGDETDSIDQGSDLSTGDLVSSYGGSLPKHTKSGFILIGWFTDPTAGSQITLSTVPSATTNYYAHWTPAATVTTVAASSITKTTATINGRIADVDPSDAFFCFHTASFLASSISWDPTQDPSGDCGDGVLKSLTATASPHNYSFELSGLTAGTTYYFMQIGIQNNHILPGVVLNFTTESEGGGGGGGGGYVPPTTPKEPEKKEPEKKEPEKKGTVQNQAPVNIPTTPNKIVPITQIVTIPVDPNSQVQAVIVNGKETKEITTPTNVKLPTIVGPKDKVEVVVTENGTKKVVPVAYIPNPITLANINFDFSSAKLTPKAKAILDNVAKVVKAHGFTYVDLSGHTDVFASAGFDNQKLSDNRSSAAKLYLQNKLKGLKVTIDTSGHAATNQVIDSTEAKARAVNRRVEIIVK